MTCLTPALSCKPKRERRGWRLPRAARSEERRVGKECRSRCDWSSDVCSSDLKDLICDHIVNNDLPDPCSVLQAQARAAGLEVASRSKIGRASCRERV